MWVSAYTYMSLCVCVYVCARVCVRACVFVDLAGRGQEVSCALCWSYTRVVECEWGSPVLLNPAAKVL